MSVEISELHGKKLTVVKQTEDDELLTSLVLRAENGEDYLLSGERSEDGIQMIDINRVHPPTKPEKKIVSSTFQNVVAFRYYPKRKVGRLFIKGVDENVVIPVDDYIANRHIRDIAHLLGVIDISFFKPVTAFYTNGDLELR